MTDQTNPIDPNDPGERAEVVNIIQKLIVLATASGATLPPIFGSSQFQQSLAFLILTALALLWSWWTHRQVIVKAKSSFVQNKNMRAVLANFQKPSGATMTLTPTPTTSGAVSGRLR